MKTTRQTAKDLWLQHYEYMLRSLESLRERQRRAIAYADKRLKREMELIRERVEEDTEFMRQGEVFVTSEHAAMEKQIEEEWAASERARFAIEQGGSGHATES